MQEQRIEVPFLDLKGQYRELSGEIDAGIAAVCRDSSFILGPQVKAFEAQFANFLGVSECVGVGTGTDALILAFKALGLDSGDEVLMPAHTFVATAIGILDAGLRPVLVDIDPLTYLMDLSKVEAAITKRTKAICVVHLYGRACDMDRVMEISKKHRLHVIEDAAQAHGATWKGRACGTFGDYGCFSFYPGKNLGAYGDGGAVVTGPGANAAELAKKIRCLRNYGSEIKYEHPKRGTNSRLDSIQAVVLSAKLKHLAAWNENRRNIARTYNESLAALSGNKLQLPEIPAETREHVWHLYVVQVDYRTEVIAELSKQGVQTGIHYPIPFYLQAGYRDLGYKKGDFPVTEAISSRILSLPMFPELSMEAVRYTCDALQKIA